MHDFKNFVIFGGLGFVGTHLRKLLREAYPQATIHVADICAQISSPTEHCVDVRNPIQIPGDFGADTLIFNLAAVHRTPGHPDYEYFETNIRGAENVCEFARKNKIRHIVFTSSISPYGAAESLKTEETLPTPNTPYGISKLVAEKTHQIWQAESELNSLSIVRPGIVFGQGENGNMTRLFKALKRKRFAYAGRRDTIKACIYVKDLVRVMLEMAKSESPRLKLYNCAMYPSHSIEEIATTMQRVTGLEYRIPFIPQRPLLLFAQVGGLLGGLGLGICPERVQKLMISTNISGKHLAEDFPLRFSLEQAMTDWWNDGNQRTLE